MCRPVPFLSPMPLRQACALVGALAAWLVWGGAVPAGLFVLFVVFLATSLAAPTVFAPVARFEERLLGLFLAGVSWSLMALIFAGFFIPARIVFSLSGKRRLAVRKNGVPDGEWTDLPRRASPDRFTRQF